MFPFETIEKLKQLQIELDKMDAESRMQHYNNNSTLYPYPAEPVMTNVSNLIEKLNMESLLHESNITLMVRWSLYTDIIIVLYEPTRPPHGVHILFLRAPSVAMYKN